MPRSFSLIVALGALCASSAASGAEIAHYERLGHLTRTAAVSASAAGKAAPLGLGFNALGRDFTLELEHNARMSAVERALRVPTNVTAYRGKLAGRPDSWARIVMAGDAPMGLVWDGQTLYAVEAAFDAGTPTTTPIIYRLDDVYIPPGTLQCGGSDIRTGPAALAAILNDAAPAVLAAQGATLSLDVGAVADYEFSQSFGVNTRTALLARLNNVDGIYSSQLGIQINVPAEAIEIFTNNDDPFTSTDPSMLLDELALYRGSTPTQDAQGLTHLFTGRDLDGTTAGIAYVGSVCAQASGSGRSYAVGLSQGTHGLTVDSLIAAHEIGHNLGAPHDAEANSPCESTPATFLMAPTINGSSTFSDCSIEQMRPVIDSADCLTPIGPPDVSLNGAAPGGTYPAASPFTYAIDVRNLGIDPATTVAVAVTLDTGLEIQAAEAAGGSCTSSGQQVDCDLGDLAGGTDRMITLTLLAQDVGAYALSAEASADQDNNASNNVWDDTLTSEASVDLGIVGSAGRVTLDASNTVDLTLGNDGEFMAHDVSLELDSGTGLDIESAELAGTACTVTAGNASCTLATLAPGASAPITVTVMGTAAGQRALAVSVTSSEPDVDPTDNTLALAISVSEPSSGGGGSAAELAMLLLPLLARRRRTGTGPDDSPAKR